MQHPSLLLLAILTIITLLVLIIGIIIMTKGGKINQEYSNKLMVARVVFQGLAILMVAFIVLMN